MRKLLVKSLIGTLLGGVFFLFGGMTASAATTPVDPLANFNCGAAASWKEGVNFDFKGCLPIWTYYLTYKPASYLLAGSGYLFDNMLDLSIQKSFIDKPFIDTSWTVVRDFSNMLFIFILIYAGINTMLFGANWRGTVIQVVIVALLINFSLFFTKVVIDAGNILAIGVKNGITLNTNETISVGLVRNFQPQSFIQNTQNLAAMDAIVLFIIAALINGYTAYVFFKVALLFLGRLVAFWFLMIISPFAFISTAMPKGNIFGFWSGTLVSQAFVAPLFLFLLYLIMQVVNAGGGILGTFQGGLKGVDINSIFDGLLAPIVVAVLILMALQKSLKLAEGMAGDFGSAGAKLAGTVLGAAGGLAGGAVLGGTALAGRAVGGRLAQNLYEKGTFQSMATSERAGALGAAQRFAGRQFLTVNESARTGTWDVRGTGLGGQIAKGGSAVGMDFGKASGKGGFEGAQKAQKEADIKFAKKLAMTDYEKELISAKYDISSKEDNLTKQQQNAAEYAKRMEEAKKARQQAEVEAKNSPEGIALTAMENQFKSQTEAAQKATADREAAQKALEGTVDTVGAQRILDEAITKETQALSAVKTTQTLVDSANAAYTTVANQKLASADQALKSAQDNFEVAQKNVTAATAEVENAKKSSKKEIEEEEKRRQGSYADYVGGKTRTGVRWATGNIAYSHKQAQETAAKIRKGKEEKEKTYQELLKEAAEKQAKEEAATKKPEEGAGH